MKNLIPILILWLIGFGAFAQKDNADDKTQEKNKKSDQDTRYQEGASGVKRSISYKFNMLPTDEDPGKGTFRYNNDTLSAITYIFVDVNDQSGEDQTKWYSTWDDTTGATGRGRINLVEYEGKNVNVFDVTGVFVRGAGYWKIPVKYVSGSLPADGVTYYYVFERIENKDKEAKTDKVKAADVAEVATAAAAVVTVAAVVAEPVQQPVVEITQTEPVVEVKEEPVAQAEPVVEVKEEPVALPEPVAQAEPVVEVKEEPVVQPEPVAAGATEAAALVTVAAVVTEPEPEPVAQITQPEPVVEVKEEPVAQPEAVTEVKSEPVVQEEVVKEESKVEEAAVVAAAVTVAAVVSEPAPEPLQITQPEPVAQVKEEPVVQQEPAVEVKEESVAPPEPVAQPEPTAEVKSEPVVQQEVVKEEIKAEEVAVAAAAVTVAAVVAEPAPAPVQITKQEPVAEIKQEPVAQPEPVVEVKSEPVVQPEPVKEESNVEEVAAVGAVGAVAVASQTEKPKTEQRVRTTEPAPKPQATVPAQPTQKPQTAEPAQPKTTTQTTQTQQPAPKTNQPAQQTQPAWPALATQAPSSGSTGTGYSITKRTDGSRIWHGIIETGYGLKVSDYGLSNYRINFISSFRLGQHFMIGLGLGYRRYFDNPEKHMNWYMVSSGNQVPVFLDLRVLFTKKKLTPFLALGLGSSTEKSKSDTTSYSSFINPSAGIWYRLSKNTALFADLAWEMMDLEYALRADNIPYRRKNNSVSLNIGIQF